MLLDSAGVVVSSSYPAGFAVGRRFALPESPTPKGSGVAATSSGPVRWATAPVLDFGGLPEATSDPATVGTVYVQIPAGVTLIVPGTTPVDPSPGTVTGAFALFVLVLAGAVPVGVAFGLLSTRRLVRRVRRLAASTVAVAEGDLHHRVPVTGTDEVSQLEHHFNLMAERLSDAMHAERQLATAGERARIARELHDSISQDLFSLRLLAGGVRKALPTASPLRAQVATMEDTATGTMHEMQALLLHLRPVALAEVGLVAAIEEVCRAYRDRLGVTIDAEIEPVELPPPVEHAILRVVQEAIANAVRHARASRIALRLTHHDGRVEVLVEDDGVGFDPARTHERHGLGLSLMRERVAEVGGALVLDSAPGEGTRVRVRL